MKNVIPLNAASGRVSRAIRAQYYKNSLRNLEVGGGRGCTGVIEVYETERDILQSPQEEAGTDADSGAP